MRTTFNAIGGFILATIIAVLLVGGIDFMAIVFGLSFFLKTAIGLATLIAAFQLRSIAKQ